MGSRRVTTWQSSLPRCCVRKKAIPSLSNCHTREAEVVPPFAGHLVRLHSHFECSCRRSFKTGAGQGLPE